MKVVFLGSSTYCLPVLEALKKNLVLVVTRNDKPVGRKKILTPSPVKLWAQQHNLPVCENIQVLTNQLTKLSPDLGLVADFGQIIPEEIFNKPKLKTFNIHFSKLPDLRGASPIQATLLRGDTTAWITIFQIEKTLDTGPILWQKSYPILSTETASDLYIRLFTEVAKELPEIINLLTANPALPAGRRCLLTAQSGTPTFCKKLTKDDGFVEWKVLQNPETCNLKPETLFNRYRAYFPWPGIWTIKDGKRMKILKCHLGKDKLVLDQIQFEGQKPQSFLN